MLNKFAACDECGKIFPHKDEDVKVKNGFACYDPPRLFERTIQCPECGNIVLIERQIW